MTIQHSANGALDPLPAALVRDAARRRLRAAVRHPRRVPGALLRLVRPGGWQPDARLRRQVLDAAVRRGDRSAAHLRALDKLSAAGTPAGRARAAALELLAKDVAVEEARVELAVAAFLRAPRPPRATASRGREGAAREAIAAAARLRAAGAARPLIVVTLPALEGNPYTALMESAYESLAMAPVHVDTLEDAEAVIEARDIGDFDAVLHVNQSTRLIWSAPDDAAAAERVRHAVERIDAWQAADVGLAVSIHDGPILRPVHAAAEQALAQAIADRAGLIHVLTASTPHALAGWLRLDPDRVVHVAIPRYDDVYGPSPSRSHARAALGLDPRDPAEGGPETVLGMIGLLSPRKGPAELVAALRSVPDPLPDGRRLRLLLAGRVIEPGGEALVRAAYGDPRIVPELGFVEDSRMPLLLAAIDVAVVPYRRFLNSSWLTLASSFGIPAIVPAGGMALESLLPDARITFEPSAPDADAYAALATALGRAPELATANARAAARASVADLDPVALSAELGRRLRALSEGRAAAP